MRPQLTVLLLTHTGWRWLKSAGVLPVVVNAQADARRYTERIPLRESHLGCHADG